MVGRMAIFCMRLPIDNMESFIGEPWLSLVLGFCLISVIHILANGDTNQGIVISHLVVARLNTRSYVWLFITGLRERYSDRRAASPDGRAVWGVVLSTRWWLLVDHCVLRNWDWIPVRAVKGLISQAGIVSICPLLWQRDVKLRQTKTDGRATSDQGLCLWTMLSLKNMRCVQMWSQFPANVRCTAVYYLHNLVAS